MTNIPKRIKERLVSNIKRFQPIINHAKDRDINEADTVTIVKDILSELFGYDKYTEITSEHQIRGTYCDLAIEIGGTIRLIIEVKAVGTELKDRHVKQAVDYAANQGTEWVALTNGITWRVFRINFSQPITKELVLYFDFLQLNHRILDDLEKLYLLTKEGRSKSALKEFHIQRQAASRYSISATLLDDSVLASIRRELRLLAPDTKVQAEDIKKVLSQEVIKREVLESDEFKEVQKKLERANKKQAKAKQQPRKKEPPPPQKEESAEAALEGET